MLCRFLLLAGCLVSLGSLAIAQTPVRPVQAPVVQKPAAPTAARPAGPAPTQASPTGNGGLVAKPYDEPALKALAQLETPVLLVFSRAGDEKWAAQELALRTILREPEFKNLVVYQIGLLANPKAAEAYGVATPGTLLILKGGIERIRSTDMVKADIIRRMLRLIPAL